jgi:hypothetical protein
MHFNFSNRHLLQLGLVGPYVKKNVHSFGLWRVLRHRKHLIILIKPCQALRRKKNVYAFDLRVKHF